MYSVYIVKCIDNSLYTGIAVNVEKRVNQHNNGKGAKYTKFRSPVKLVYTESNFSDRSSASKREYEIKHMTREQKLSLIALNSSL